ncbi:hypothetical protein CYLTODRAFT_410296 [Cylindrobasidium torrendii FP15055 ss-10]|uniref:Uncharacterized protein n=1 Tax=Cylindrobasidium torrendii FP15055 ss-10 TaxID=1314674 RepID=A0A0D7BED9_9AGAR|nr:hypothetical protein CYLTODRAFT_410296 [Cylindrobasidium torrendii FP15055 ss-10]
MTGRNNILCCPIPECAYHTVPFANYYEKTHHDAEWHYAFYTLCCSMRECAYYTIPFEKAQHDAECHYIQTATLLRDALQEKAHHDAEWHYAFYATGCCCVPDCAKYAIAFADVREKVLHDREWHQMGRYVNFNHGMYTTIATKQLSMGADRSNAPNPMYTLLPIILPSSCSGLMHKSGLAAVYDEVETRSPLPDLNKSLVLRKVYTNSEMELELLIQTASVKVENVVTLAGGTTGWRFVVMDGDKIRGVVKP